jgi:uroporphyrinogen-III synthase
VRLIVTRPLVDAEALKDKLETLGHEVVLSPLLEIIPAANAVVPDQHYQMIALTSANGARALSHHESLPKLHHLPVLTVGPQSAEAARRAGFTDVTMAGGDAAELAGYIARTRDPKAGPVLYMSGRESAGDFAGRLKNAAFIIVRVIAYEAKAASELAPAVSLAVDGVLLYSPRTARIWAELAGRQVIDVPAMMHICISHNTAAMLPESWPRRIAAEPSEAAMLDLIAEMDVDG